MDNETLLTSELYEKVIDDLVKDVVKLKQKQGKSINRIQEEKNTLRLLKEQLKLLKKDIRSSKRTLSMEKRKLTKINNTLEIRKHSITDLNCNFITEEKKTINLTEFTIEQPKRR